MLGDVNLNFLEWKKDSTSYNLHEFSELIFDKIDNLIPKFKTFSDKKRTDILLFGINLDSEELDSRNIKISFVQIFILQILYFKLDVSNNPLNIPSPWSQLCCCLVLEN